MFNKIKCNIYIIFVLSLYSCKREQMFHFTTHDSLYFNVYDTLKEYTFHTNKGTDTLRVNKKQIRDLYSEWYFNNLETSVFNASFFCGGVFIHNGAEYEIWYRFRKKNDKGDPLFAIKIGARITYDVTDLRNYYYGRYNDVIVIDSANSEIIDIDRQLCEFDCLKWHKFKGIVEYKLSDGTIYKDSTLEK